MKKIGQIYRSGIWMVKQGMTEEFITAWLSSANWLVENIPGEWDGEALLLQDFGNPHKFISFAWSGMPETADELLASAEFQGIMAEIRELCEDIQPHRMQVVGYSAPKDVHIEGL